MSNNYNSVGESLFMILIFGIPFGYGLATSSDNIGLMIIIGALTILGFVFLSLSLNQEDKTEE